MDDPNDRLNRFLASYGAGKDAAGRTVYSGPGVMYMGPGEFAATRATHAGLEADAMKYDPQGQLIRRLLDQLQEKSMAGKANIPVYPIGQPANTTIHYQG